MNTTVEITETGKPALQRLQTASRTGAVNRQIGRAVMKLLKNHFRALPPNKRGFPTTHFWRRAASAMSFQADRDSIHVSVNQVGVSQRFLGGDIDPVRAKFLTIPAIAETYGHRAGDFSDLKVVRGPFKMYTGRFVSLALAPKDWKPNPASPDDSTGVYFWLVCHVSQLPDPKVLPTKDEIRQTALNAARAALR